MKEWIPRIAALGACTASALTLPIATEVRVKRATRPLTDQWRHMPIVPQRSTLVGISFRPPQVDALGLDARATLDTLLAFPFQLIRLGAYWNRVEPEPGRFCPEEIDWQVDAAERVGKQIILCVGAVKTFGYPEYFVPAHHLRQPLREGKLVQPAAHRPLLTAATAFVTRIVERYRDHRAIVAWQAEHEAVDPLGMEHSCCLPEQVIENYNQCMRWAAPLYAYLFWGAEYWVLRLRQEDPRYLRAFARVIEHG